MEVFVSIAMNTIPTIFNERKISYTILGKNEFDTSEKDISAIILNRGHNYHLNSVFKNLIKTGFSSIVVIENSQRNFELEQLSSQFPSIQFLLPAEKISIGEMINIGMSEVSSKYVLVTWSDILLQNNIFNLKITEELNNEKYIAAAPILFDIKKNNIPVQIVPAISGKDFFTEPFVCKQNLVKTLYLYDFVGIYNRNKFLQLGGFDYTIINPHWQNLDFNFRVYLWGYENIILNTFKMNYESQLTAEDISVDDSYFLFYLKNLAVNISRKGAYIPNRIFFSYMLRSGLNPFKVYRQFKAAKNWINMYKHNFQITPHKLIAEWEPVL